MPLNPASYPAKSGLVNEVLEGQLSQLFGKLAAPVEITCILGSDDKSAEMAALLVHICSLSAKIQLTLLSPGEDSALDAALDASLLPATAVGNARMVFHGIPGGREITAFASAILTAGGAAKPLDRFTMKSIGKIQQNRSLQIYVALDCAHCCQLVTAAQRIAWENGLVTAHMIDANLYPALVAEKNIQRVPMTFINGEAAFPGGKTMAELTSLLAKYK